MSGDDTSKNILTIQTVQIAPFQNFNDCSKRYSIGNKYYIR